MGGHRVKCGAVMIAESSPTAHKGIGFRVMV